jgi:uncharacterized protein YfaS (alpha-2-macroglobulin family)
MSALRLAAAVLAACALLPPAARAADPDGFRVVGHEVVAERDRPQVCVTFSEPPARPDRADHRRFLAADPAARLEAFVRDRTLCVEGLAHGARHVLTLAAGLPAASGRTLAEPVEIEAEVPDRAPSIAFRGPAGLLPRIGPEGLPMRTVNVDRLALSVRRIGDPALVERLHWGRLSGAMTEYDAAALVRGAAETVWEGAQDIEGARNVPVAVAFPIGRVLGGLPPGVYVAAASAGDGGPRAERWFVVSDLDLLAVAGDDGLTVFARRRAAGGPAAGAELRLFGADGRELGRATADAEGVARFPPEALAGTGEAAPAGLSAAASGGDVAFVDMGLPGVDPTPAGAAARPAPGPADAYVVTDRAAYRPGETVHAVALLRDERARALPGRTLRLVLVRPDGVEAVRADVPDGGAGGHAAALALPAAAMAGTWRLEARLAPDAAASGTPAAAAAVGAASIRVDEAAPPPLAVRVAAVPVPGGGGAAEVSVQALRLSGPPGATLAGEASLVLRPAAAPFPDLQGYRFGLAQEDGEPVRRALPGFVTDAEGRAAFRAAPEPAEGATRPLEAVLRVVVHDVGGRAAVRETTLPLRTRTHYLGVRPLFDGGGVPAGTAARFEVAAVSADGARIAREGLRYEVFEEALEFTWFEAQGRWDYRREVRDRRIGGGALAVGTDRPATVEVPVEPGRYRVEVFDPAAPGVATSVRFAAGWWAGASPAETPDRVDVVPMLPAYAPGRAAWIYVRPPYEADVLVAVADRRLRTVLSRRIGPEGGLVEVPVDPDWAPGINVVAAAFATGEPAEAAAPRRAIGVGWIGLDPAPRTLGVEIAAPARAAPGRPLSVPVTVTGAAEGETVRLALWAADDGLLRASGYEGPRPAAHFLGRRRLAVTVRDAHGRLIEPADRPARLGAGASAADPGAAVPAREGAAAALFAGPVTVGPDGRAEVVLDLPDADAALRIHAMAWSQERVGRGQATLRLARDVVVAASVPRYMAPGDRALVDVEVGNRAGSAGDHAVELVGEGGVRVEGGPQRIAGLQPGGSASVRVAVVAEAAGDAAVRATVRGPDGIVFDRRLPVLVRPTGEPEIRRARTRLDPGAEAEMGRGLADGLTPGTVAAALSASPGPLTGLPALLATLDRAAHGSADQTGARALALLAGAEAAPDPAEADALRERAARALDRLASLRRPDGAFARWSPSGPAEPWLTAFAADALMRARAAGAPVQEDAVAGALAWLARFAENSWVAPAELPARAYALHLLARAGSADPAAVRFFAATHGAALQTDLARAHAAAALAAVGAADEARAMAAGVDLRREGAEDLRDSGSVLRDAAAAYVVLAESRAVPADELAALAARLAALAAEAPAFGAQEAGWLVMAGRLMGAAAGPARVVVDGAEASAAGAVRVRLVPERLPALVRNAGDRPLEVLATAAGVPAAPPPPRADGMEVSRRLFHPDGRPADPTAVPRGALLVAVVQGTARDPRTREAIVVDPLPAGFEAEALHAGDGAVTAGLGWLGPAAEPRFADFRADRVVAAVEVSPEAPSFRVAYLVRATAAGAFVHPAPRAEDSQRPRVSAVGAEGAVRVTD